MSYLALIICLNQKYYFRITDMENAKNGNFLNDNDIFLIIFFKKWNIQGVFQAEKPKKASDIKFRRTLLQKLSKEKNKKYINENINSVQSVLFENHENGYSHGLTENYIRVYVKSDNKYKNKIKRVKLIKDEGHIIGQFYE